MSLLQRLIAFALRLQSDEVGIDDEGCQQPHANLRFRDGESEVGQYPRYAGVGIEIEIHRVMMRCHRQWGMWTTRRVRSGVVCEYCLGQDSLARRVVREPGPMSHKPRDRCGVTGRTRPLEPFPLPAPATRVSEPQDAARRSTTAGELHSKCAGIGRVARVRHSSRLKCPA